MNNGVTIIGKWKNGILSGDCIFFTPFGAKIYGKFAKGKLHGWVFACYNHNI